MISISPSMTLVRRLRESGGSLCVPSPRDLCRALEIEPGHTLEFLVEKGGELRLRPYRVLGTPGTPKAER